MIFQVSDDIRQSGGIYLITGSKGTYIGQTHCFYSRFQWHKNNWCKYGENATFEVLLVSQNNHKHITRIEDDFIYYYQPTINATNGR